MSMTGLDVFDRTVQTSNEWLKDLMFELNYEDRHKAYLALKGVLHTLRDRLPVHEAVHLAAQLPMLIRGVYYDGWSPSQVPARINRPEEFFLGVKQAFMGDEQIDAERITRAVFKMLRHRISAGEIRDITSTLPPELQVLWPQPM
jgi:uncharacterized protein (DUF2267 family)